jgi:hypothetical protein
MADAGNTPPDKNKSAAFNAAAAPAQPAKPHFLALTRLRCTQITVGMKQVERKQEKLRKLQKDPTALMDLLLEKPIRVVMGPDGNAYIIDHHHLALAMLREGYETAPVDIVKDFSQPGADGKKMSMTEFWKTMEDLKYVHPVDANGKKQPVSAIPQRLTALKDDPYRALAGFVRDEGGFKKVDTPFTEFDWADYFRALIPRDELEKDFEKDVDKAVKKAMKLAHLPGAAHLPGYSPHDVNPATTKPKDASTTRAPLVELAKLLPTRIAIAMKIAENKQEKLAKLLKRPQELLDYFLGHPIPAVKGPGGALYAVGRTPLALAMQREGFEKAPVNIVDDFSDCTAAQFWKKMREHNYCRPIDENGREKSVDDIPKRLPTLKDDPYLLLAHRTRDALGKPKPGLPAEEEKWINRLREEIPAKLLEKDFDKALKKAMDIAPPAAPRATPAAPKPGGKP